MNNISTYDKSRDRLEQITDSKIADLTRACTTDFSVSRVTDPRVSVVIVSFNTRDLILNCLDCVFRESLGSKPEVIVVDNASADGSASAIAERFSDVRVIALDNNIGFAAACNLGAGEAVGEYLLFLNPDTAVLNHAIDSSLDYLCQHTDIGLLGVRTIYADGTLNPTSCFAIPSLWSMFCAATGLAAVCSFSPFWNSEAIGGWDRRDIRDVGVVTGCFAMISKALWDSLGGFDERFFIYSEDTDLSIRVTELGKRCVLLGTVEVIHYGGQSDSIRAQKIMRIFAARIQFMHKHRGGFVAGLARRILYLHTLVRVAGYGITGSVRPARRHFFHTWLDVWRTRHRWLQGDSHVVTPASG